MSVTVVGLSHHSAPVSVRERFSVKDSSVPEILAALRDRGLVSEAVLLSTCNRVELYVVAEGEAAPDPAAIRRYFLELARPASATTLNSDPGDDEFERSLYTYAGPRSVEHLFRVACGLDSMVLGETEILGQLKQAYKLALDEGFTGKRLNKLFQRSFNLSKRIRTETNIQRGSTSVASVAVELAEKVFESLSGRRVLVLGAGDTSEKTARALVSRGATSIFVSNRSHDRAKQLADTLGGQAVLFDQWEAIFEQVDITISSTSAPHFILGPDQLRPLMRPRANRPVLLIDIAVPRDIDPAVNLMDNVYLYNVDDLKMIAEEYLNERRRELVVCEEAVRAATAEWMKQWERSAGFKTAPYPEPRYE